MDFVPYFFASCLLTTIILLFVLGISHYLEEKKKEEELEEKAFNKLKPIDKIRANIGRAILDLKAIVGFIAYFGYLTIIIISLTPFLIIKYGYIGISLLAFIGIIGIICLLLISLLISYNYEKNKKNLEEFIYSGGQK